jgi:hypothetical protein
MAKPEQKLYQILKKNTPSISWDRIENWAIPGLPDLLGYARNGFFFTVELKVAKGNIIKFSPHVQNGFFLGACVWAGPPQIFFLCAPFPVP